MTLLQELKAQQRRERNGKKKRKKKASKKRRKKATKKRKKKTTKKRAPKRRTTTKRRKKGGAAVGAYSFGALMRRGGKRKINVERTRSRIRNLYKQGELGEANRLRARLKAAGYAYK